MIVDYEAAKVALDAVDWKITSQPKVTVHLSDPDEEGLAELTISGSPHATEETVVAALALQPGPTIRKHTPSHVGQVMTEGPPPAAGAARASIQPKGRITKKAARAAKRPTEQADLVEANKVATPSRRPSTRRK